MKPKNTKNRLDLAKHFASLGFKTGAEIGVLYGRYAQILCQTIPNLKLFCVDSWHNKGHQLEIAREKLAPYNTVIIAKPSLDAAKAFANASLDFVFIDANHEYASVKQDIQAWTPKVRPEGIVSGHDYYVFFHTKNRGVIDAVDEYVARHGYQLHTTSFDYTVANRDDRQPCWYFFKPKYTNI